MAVIVAVLVPLSAEAQYVWTGLIQPTGWQGQLTPPNDGTANLYFGNSVYPLVTLSSSLDDVSFIILADGQSTTLASVSPITLTLAGGISSADSNSSSLFLGSNINLGVADSPTLNAGENSIYVAGAITGTGSLTLTAGAAGGSFIFSNPTGNTYAGSTTIGDTSSDFVDIAFWNSSPFGTGTVTFDNGGELVAHNLVTISNPLVINSVGSSNNLILKSWDDPLTFSGSVTLDNSVVISVKDASKAVPAASDYGSVELPGPVVVNPVIFSGDIGQDGSPSSLTVNSGVGVLFLTGPVNWYTGGTIVGGSTTAGNLVFGDVGSVPTYGTITVNKDGYLGTADTSGSSTSFATLLTSVNSSSTGSFGIDTLPGQPTTTYSGVLNLSGFTANPPVEIGTATSAILTGTIIPQSSSFYRFGGGGGTLYVDTPLANVGVTSTGVIVTDPGNSYSLTVYLQGTNTYTGATSVSDGFLIFDGAGAIPSGSQFTAVGSSTSVGGSYLGYTNNTVISPTTFLSYFTSNVANTWGIIGFDTASGDSTVTINGVNLSGFNNGVFIGTATSAILTGTLTPSTVTNGNNSANTLRFTAALSGVLTVDSTIADNGSPVKVVLGSPSPYGQFSSGTVIMDGLGTGNTYTGGTLINAGNPDGLTVALGSSTALGSGAVTITQPATTPGGEAIVGLQASAGSVNLANPISIQDTGSNNSARLYLTGSNPFTLSGPITGDSAASIVLDDAPLTVTLSGNNSAFLGNYSVYNGTLNLDLPTNSALGQATLDFEGPGTIKLTGAPNPVIESINNFDNAQNVGTLDISGVSTLTIDTTNDGTFDASTTYGGTITGSGGLVVNDSTGNSGTTVLLYGSNSYTGGTTVTNYGVLVAANSSALGTNTVTVNTNGNGALALDGGITLTNPLNFISGNLAGDGTFNPSGLGLSGIVTVGSGQGIAGGLPFDGNGNVTGTLSFAGNMVFNNGGQYYWTLQDNSRSDGASQIDVAGNLTINATEGGFNLFAATYDANGNGGNPASNFNINAPASWVILTTGGTIQNFSASDFTINASNFETGNSITSSNFSLTENGSDNELILNFTPVPEPSTWALLGAGLVALALAGIRRKRLASVA